MQTPNETPARDFVQAVTDFIFVENKPAPCDVIFIPGSSHPEHILLAARYCLEGYAPWVLPSGRFSVKADAFKLPGYETEWAWMRSVLIRAGVPESAILREDRAAYTWQNAQFSRQATDARGIVVRRGMLCCQAFHARRALLYYQAAFPETEWLVCPAVSQGLSRDSWYRTPQGRARVLGEVARLGNQIQDVLEGMFAAPSGVD